MSQSDVRPVGLTQDVGYEIGVRRTLPLGLDAAWRLVTSAEGLHLWLGELPAADFAPDSTYHLVDGATGEIRVFKPRSHVRLTWQPPGWSRPSTIQVRVIPSGERTTIAFHQEHLPDGAAREARRAHFATALDGLQWLIGIA